MEKGEAIKAELDSLVLRGRLLYFAMLEGEKKLPARTKEQLEQEKIKLPEFRADYEGWYSVSLRVVKQILPDRADDFIAQYKNPKRKAVTHETYTVSDYLLSLQIIRFTEKIVDTSSAVPKFERQFLILQAAREALDSYLVDLSEVLQADLFDSELDAAAELCKNGFTRGAGAVAGVVLERHLKHVCDVHDQKSRKKHPTISDFNDMLKQASVIDTPKWRFVQHLGDLRNLCDHPKERDPTKDDVAELIEGVKKATKTIF